MRVNVELDAFLELLGQFASDAKDAARIEFPGTAADGVILGISYLYRRLRKDLAATAEFDLSPDDNQALRGAVGRFCREVCDGSKGGPPGSHERCPQCPLMPFTVERVEEVVRKALEE